MTGSYDIVWYISIVLGVFGAVIILIFILFPVSNLTAYVFASLMGILWLSTIPPTQGTITTVFGIKNMSMLYGIAFLFHQVIVESL